MKNNRILLLVMFLLALAFPAMADDADIYLKKGAAATPPYLMLMLDYRPNTISGQFCSSFSDCVPQMTAASFGKLCARYGFDAVTSPVLTQENKEAICRKWFQDFQADEDANYTF